MKTQSTSKIHVGIYHLAPLHNYWWPKCEWQKMGVKYCIHSRNALMHSLSSTIMRFHSRAVNIGLYSICATMEWAGLERDAGHIVKPLNDHHLLNLRQSCSSPHSLCMHVIAGWLAKLMSSFSHINYSLYLKGQK